MSLMETTNPRASKSRGVVFVHRKFNCTDLVEVLVNEDWETAEEIRELL